MESIEYRLMTNDMDIENATNLLLRTEPWSKMNLKKETVFQSFKIRIPKDDCFVAEGN
jgi:hypothetical protein